MMSVRSAAFGAALAVFLLSPLLPAGAANPGAEAFQRQDYATALKHWLPYAKAGNVEMQYYVGLSYEMSLDPVRAAEWYSKAVRGNHADALERLIVVAFEHGHTYDTSPIVFRTLKDRAKGGNAAGVYNLGRYYVARAHWYQRSKQEDSLDNTNLQDAWALFRVADELGLAAAAEQATRIWPYITSEVGRDHARAQVDRWRAAFGK